jgi:hypothetical protein
MVSVCTQCGFDGRQYIKANAGRERRLYDKLLGAVEENNIMKSLIQVGILIL